LEDERIKLLMVEDDKVDRMAFERLVRSEGLPYDYTCVGSVGEGKRLLKKGGFDVVVTDYMLGDGTAFDLFDEVDSDVPIVLVTGAGGEEVAVQAMKAGASDYLMKDVGGSYLKTLPITVANTLKSKRTERELRTYHEKLEKLVEERTLQLQEKNVQLKNEIEERKYAQSELRFAHDKLEIRVEKRTSELRQTNAQLLNQIAERKRAEEGARRSKETVEAILNSTTECAFLLDRDGTFIALNKPTVQMLARTMEELVGNLYFDVVEGDLAATRRARFDEVVGTGTAARFEDTENDKIFDHSYHPVFGSDGSVERVSVFVREITEQKRAHEVLVEKQRLAALGEMAGGVAHNFNNLLQIVIGASGLAEGDLDAGDIAEVKNTLKQIMDCALSGSETVKQLQDFARVRTADPTADGQIFDLSDTVRRAMDVSRPLWKSGPEKRGVKLKLKWRFADDCLVKGKPNELFEVIVNLIKNATEAMPDGGKIYLKTYIEDDQVFLVARDNGMGIAREHLPKVFEPFWTTKGVQGTGMGLSTSFGIVSRHGGLISVDGWEGKGAVFTVQMPLAREPTDKEPVAAEPLVDFKAKVLVVDDQPPLVDWLAKGLTRSGQAVVQAGSGEEGIELFNRNSVDLVVCDLGMPDMNGWQVAGAIRELCKERGIPKTPFILLTGWGGQIAEQEKMAECGVDRIAEKPIKFNVLLDMMRRLLDEQATSGHARESVVGQ